MSSKNTNGRKTLALLAAAATLAGGLTAGTAYAGGGGGNRPGTGGGLSANQFWRYKDDATGSWGSATDLNSVRRAMAAAGVELKAGGGESKAQAALGDANAECVAGFHRRHPGEGDGDCRVVAVGAVATEGVSYDGTGQYDKSVWYDNWNKYVAPNEYQYAGSQYYHTGDGFSDDPSNSVDKLMQRNVEATAQPSIVVIVLDKYQPAPPNYTLSVADMVTTSRNGSSISENVTGTSTLRWAGVDGTTHNTWNGDTEVTAEGYYYASEDETILQPVARKDGETVDQITSTLR